MGFFYFVYYTYNISNENINATEAIVIYGENKERLYIGAKLLNLGYAPIIFVTGDKPKEDYTNFIKENKLTPEQFLFDEELANNHLSPVNDVLAFLKKYQFKNIRIILDRTQIPRAKLKFSTKISSGITVIFHPVSRKREKRRSRGRGRSITNNSEIIIEYLKYKIILLASLKGIEDELDLSYC